MPSQTYLYSTITPLESGIDVERRTCPVYQGDSEYHYQISGQQHQGLFILSTSTQNNMHALRGRGLPNLNVLNFGSLTPNKLHLWLVQTIDRTLPFLLKCSLTGRRFY